MRKLHTNKDHVYTTIDIEEIRKCKNDIIYFCKNYVKIQHPVRGGIKFDPYDCQIETLRNYDNTRFNIMLHTRQSGVTTSMAAYILWYSIFNMDKSVMIGTPKLAWSRDILNKIRYAYEELPLWLRPNLVYGEWTKSRMGFDNGSIIRTDYISTNMGRGMAISLLCIDGMAYASKAAQDEFWTGILPCLSASTGKCNIASGLNTEGDTFTKMWEFACETPDHGFSPQFIKWNDVPGRDEEFKRLTIERIGEGAWRHEYECSAIRGE